MENQRRREEERRITRSGKAWDLSKINFDKLKEDFQRASYKYIEIADLPAFIQRKLEQMLQQNATRSDFAQRLQSIIDAYNHRVGKPLRLSPAAFYADHLRRPAGSADRLMLNLFVGVEFL